MMNTDDIDSRFGDTMFIVEATSFEQLTLWELHSTQGIWFSKYDLERKRYDWEFDNDDIWYQIGELDNSPVTISFRWYKIDGYRIVFYECTSGILDRNMIKEWFERCCMPIWDGTRRAHCNAMNFHHCLQAIDDLNRKENNDKPG